MEKTTGLPSYFVVDSRIIEDSNINFFEKTLYSVLCALSNNEKNYCFASNKYLANILKCSIRNIQRGLMILKNYGYIEIEIKNYNTRIIRTTINIILDIRNQKLEEVYSRPKKELLDYNWMKGEI